MDAGRVDNILSQIDAAVEVASDSHFDEDYWQGVDSRPPSCGNCGFPIENAETSTGWTHVGNWQGVRCPGRLCGATPATRRPNGD